MKKKMTDAQLHSAGATVRHNSPYSDLKSYANQEKLSKEFIDQWVVPYYFELKNFSDEWIEKMIQLKPSITEEIILNNLGAFNWRPRSTGSYFATIKQMNQLEEIIGVHLLKSEVCFSGVQYAYCLASFNTKKSVSYLDKYLDYYLKQPQLEFDQKTVLLALKYLDELNGTNNIEKHLADYENFVLKTRENTVNNLEYLHSKIPEDKEAIEDQINKMEAPDFNLDTSYFNSNLIGLFKIING